MRPRPRRCCSRSLAAAVQRCAQPRASRQCARVPLATCFALCTRLHTPPAPCRPRPSPLLLPVVAWPLCSGVHTRPPGLRPPVFAHRPAPPTGPPASSVRRVTRDERDADRDRSHDRSHADRRSGRGRDAACLACRAAVGPAEGSADCVPSQLVLCPAGRPRDRRHAVGDCSSFHGTRARARCSSTTCTSWRCARRTVPISFRCRRRRSAPWPSTRGAGSTRRCITSRITGSCFCSRAPGTGESWARVDRKMLWSPAASSDRQRRRVLARVKVCRYAPPPLRGAGNLDAGSAHALRLAPCLTMPNGQGCCQGRPEDPRRDSSQRRGCVLPRRHGCRGRAFRFRPYHSHRLREASRSSSDLRAASQERPRSPRAVHHRTRRRLGVAAFVRASARARLQTCAAAAPFRTGGAFRTAAHLSRSSSSRCLPAPPYQRAKFDV